MAFPLVVDTTKLTFMVAGDYEPVTDYETKQPKADRNGVPLVLVDLVVSFRNDFGRAKSEVIRVKVPDPKPFAQGTSVRVADLVAVPWSQDGKSGVAYRATAVESAVSAAGKPSA